MGDEEDETRGLEYGAIDFLTKPISPPIVRARVKNHLELKRGRDLLKQFSDELAAKNATLEKEKALAHRLLEAILPLNLQIRGFRTAVYFKPSNQIGGDFFDGWRDGNHAHFLIGDISGHSISAALLMAVCKGLFMSIGKDKNDPAEIIATANRTLSRMLTESGMYLTMIYAVCDIRKRILRVASAGHNPAYLYASSLRVPIESTGPPIGWSLDDSWSVTEVPFAEGDKIFLYTDGVVEARSPDGEYCRSDFFAAVDATLAEEAMVGKVLGLAEEFCAGSFDDDLTLFAIGYDAAALSPGAT
jgi:sigma-B regulation protein RsbU (phosphoserine phosphatase)